MSVTLYNHQLHALLRPVVPIASTQRGFPGDLDSVWIQRQGDYLYAAATNRYVLGVQRIKADTAQMEGPLAALVKVDHIKHLLRLFPTNRRANPAVVLTRRPLDGGSGPQRISVATLGVGTKSALALHDHRPDREAPLIDVEYALLSTGRFPDIFKVIGEKLAEEKPDRIDRVGINLRQLALFAAAPTAGPGEPAALYLGKTEASPLAIQYGSDFLGLIMPVRLDSLSDKEDVYRGHLAAWREVLAPLQDELTEAKK